jgi:hypothetical protein
VTVTRRHNGGYTDQEWWNHVNADYMRVYVPRGSRLLSVEGQTREINDPPLDYDALGFKRDPDVDAQEKNMVIDQETGTRIYEESGKTVFGNWVYVSPQETATVKYTYVLPFKVRPGSSENGDDSYSVTYQKQSGSVGSHLESHILYPSRFKADWQSGENLVPYDGGLELKGDLNVDRSMEAVFSEKQGG